ncbi:MAG: arsenate reductase ArsC [Proteobacteria bacterium]|nr:arsenate reductase ArsC [Pseudomonadota bacterium]
MANKQKILFLCTGNSCRSQMAEALCRDLKGEIYEVYSAGTERHGLNPRAVKVLAESGLDISSYSSKTLEDLGEIEFDQVVTVCANADQNCPTFTGNAKISHVGFDDPPKLAQNAQTEEQALQHFRRVRDEIRDFVMTLPQYLN